MAFFLTTIGLKVKSPKVGDAARSSETRVSSNAPTQNQQQLNNSNHGLIFDFLSRSIFLSGVDLKPNRVTAAHKCQIADPR